MLLLTLLTLSLLAFINYRIGGRALLYPPVVFCGIWAFDLFLLWLDRDFFYPLLPETLFIFLCGGFVFSLCCWAAMLLRDRKPEPKPTFSRSSNRIITGLVVLGVVALPFFLRWLYGLVTEHGGGLTAGFIFVARLSLVEIMGKSMAFTFFGTLIELATIVAMVAFYERERHPWRAVVAITTAFTMNVVMGAKVGPLTVAVSLLGIDWIKTRRVRWKLLIVMLVIMLAATVMIEFYVHLGGGSLQEKAGPILHQVVFYASGGMVGFDRVVRQPNVVPQINSFHIWYLRILRRMGAQVEIPEVAEFVTIGPRSVADNVYTVYWDSIGIGYWGAVLWIGLIGFLVTLVYKSALQGHYISIFLFALFLRNLVFSPFTEYFVSNAYFMVKLIAVVWFIYSGPAQWGKFKAFVRRGVEAELVRAQ